MTPKRGTHPTHPRLEPYKQCSTTMKKGKSPAILVTVLVLFLGSCAFINAYITENNRSEEDKVKDEIAKLQNQPSGKSEDGRDLVNAASRGLMGGEAQIAKKGKTNTLVKPNIAPYTTNKDHNNPAGQWYDPMSADANGLRDGKPIIRAAKPNPR